MSDMLEIKIINDETGNEITGNYDYYILINGNQVYQGRIEYHDRRTGWDGVIRMLAQQFPRPYD